MAFRLDFSPPLFRLDSDAPTPLLFERSDGSFWLLGQPPLPPLIIGPGHLLVEHALAEYLQTLDVARVGYEPTTILDRATDTAYRTHTRVRVGQFFRLEDLPDIPLDGLRLLTLHDADYFVNEALRAMLDTPAFPYLHFRPGFEGMAAHAD